MHLEMQSRRVVPSPTSTSRYFDAVARPPGDADLGTIASRSQVRTWSARYATAAVHVGHAHLGRRDAGTSLQRRDHVSSGRLGVVSRPSVVGQGGSCGRRVEQLSGTKSREGRIGGAGQQRNCRMLQPHVPSGRAHTGHGWSGPLLSIRRLPCDSSRRQIHSPPKITTCRARLSADARLPGIEARRLAAGFSKWTCTRPRPCMFSFDAPRRCQRGGSVVDTTREFGLACTRGGVLWFSCGSPRPRSYYI